MNSVVGIQLAGEARIKVRAETGPEPLPRIVDGVGPA